MPSQTLELKAANKRLAVLEDLYVIWLNGGFDNYVDKRQIPGLQNMHKHYQSESMLEAFKRIPKDINKTREEVRTPFELAPSRRNKKEWEILFNNPEFENVYKSTKLRIDELSRVTKEAKDLERARVTYSKGIISQGSYQHSFKSEDCIRLLNYLWARRYNAERSDSITPSRRIPRSKLEIELGFGSVKRLNDVINALNRELTKKHINAKIRRSESSIYLETIDLVV